MKKKSKIMAIGHRGCRDLRPENTIAAYKHALELGVDAVECDVHLTKDGNLVVYHDYFLNPDLTRNAKGSWIEKATQPICEQTFAELSTYKLGRVKPETEYAKKHPDIISEGDESIPTLKDVIGLVKKYPKTRLLIEIKTTPYKPKESSNPALIAKAVVEEIQKENIQDHCEVSAFDWKVMELVKQLDSSIKLSFNHVNQPISNSLWYGGYDLKDYHNFAPALIKKLGGGVWCAQYAQLTQEKIKQSHELGIKVYAWTVNTEKDMQDLIDMDVDAIITDRPDILVSLLRNT